MPEKRVALVRAMDYNYKPFLAVPLLLLIASVASLIGGYLQTGEWFERGIDLKGGTIITIPGSVAADIEPLVAAFGAQVRTISGFGGERTLVQAPAEANPQAVLSALAGAVDVTQASVQTVGPALGENFWRQAQIAILLAFVLMGSVVFFLFRKIVPSFTVIYTTAFDIVETLAIMQLLSIPLSLAGLAALLMLIGYSVDTDILLDSSMFKRAGTVREKFRGALKTGLTMSLTTMGVLVVLLLMGLSPVISEIAAILLIGLVLDLANTWFMNAGVLMLYLERRGSA